MATREIVVAQMTVGYMAIRETFTSRVVLEPDKLLVRRGGAAGRGQRAVQPAGEPLGLRGR